jgi:hypothetical protein
VAALATLAVTAGCGPSCGNRPVAAARPSPAATSSAAPQPQATPGGQALTPPARWDAAIAYDGAHDVLVLFGGTGVGGAALTDTWTFDGRRWSRQPSSDSPSAARSGAMTFDGASGRVVLFAGSGQTWTWDGQRWTHEHPAHEPARPGELAYDPSLGVVVLFAPSDAAGSHTWGWNGADWYLINEALTEPPGLDGLAYDARGARLIGLGSGTWAFIGNRWSRLGGEPDGFPPGNQAIASAQVVNAPVVFGGGASDSVGLTAALWSWDGKAWQRRDTPTAPEARRNAMLGDDQKRQQLVLFGGIGAGGALGDTWTWTPDKGWSRVS